MNQTANSKNDQPLESWKEIANYLQRDVRTVARWEKNEGLPVHRHEHHRRASVYAFPCEIEAWRAARRPQAESAPPVPLWRRLEAWAALGVGVAALLVITYGPFLNPRDPVAEAADGSMRAEQFWAGDNVDDYSRLSADGKWLSYIDWSTGDLWLHDMTSGAKRLITGRGSWDENRSYPETHALSRDGGHIAYAWVDHDNKKFQLRVGPVPRENETHESKVIFDSPSDETGFIEVFGWLSGSDILFLHTEADTARFLIGNAEQGKATALKSLRWSYPRELPSLRAAHGLPMVGSRIHSRLSMTYIYSRPTGRTKRVPSSIRPMTRRLPGCPMARTSCFAADAPGMRRSGQSRWRTAIGQGRPDW